MKEAASEFTRNATLSLLPAPSTVTSVETGALVEGILDVPVGTRFVLDLGDGQLAVSTVVRARRHQQGLKFEEPLVNDGNGGFCTSRRVPPYSLATAGMPLDVLPPGYYDSINRPPPPKTVPQFSTTGDWKNI